ncbi:CBO0543 family protein [Bacillus sp. 1P10SD]|uniref:CBO0543 family protein n=1 Tax=Bacillus sp. 1P10SD TaxID=3132265 RepID=UPI0039A4757E
MNTVKHLNGSSLQPLPKKRYTFWSKQYVACIVFASLLGSYMDLFFVGKQLYKFPIRPFPEIFPINIVFTLVGLPILVYIFLQSISKVNKWGRAGIILFVSLLMSIFEKLAEVLGLFVHSARWEHLYTFFGYMFFLSVISFYHDWIEKTKD